MRFIVGFLLCATMTFAQNWPSFRGPMGSGAADEMQPPVDWDAEKGTNIAWKTPMPDRSGSTPAIWGDRIFLNVAEGKDLVLWCVDKAEGTVIWKRPMASGNYEINKQNMSSPSPVTDGSRLSVIEKTAPRTSPGIR